MELNDKVRAWYDLRESGELSKPHPFQSALGTSRLLYSKKSSDILEANLIEFCRSIPKTNTLKPNILKTRLSYDNSSTIKSSGNSFRLSDGIALADDLYASNEALSKRMLCAQHEEMERFKSLMMDEQRKLMEESRKLPPPAPEIVVPSHSNKFRSAKDQFTSEVFLIMLLQFIYLLYSLFIQTVVLGWTTEREYRKSHSNCWHETCIFQ